MNGASMSLDAARDIAEAAAEASDFVDVMLCPPATLISRLDMRCAGTPLLIGAQNCHAEQSGAFTGEISSEMLADAGATAVICGHSERREYNSESSARVKEKALAAHRANLKAIICVGETETERRAGKAADVIQTQLAASLPSSSTPDNTIIAYEPVWAIGTGLTPSPNDIGEMHSGIRLFVSDILDQARGAGMRILYGGSVKPSNASQILALENVDGALVGGASLTAEDFVPIFRHYVPLAAVALEMDDLQETETVSG